VDGLFMKELPREARAVASEVRNEITDDRVTGLAAEMAFFVVLSVFPGLIVLAATLGSLDFIMGEEVAADAQQIVIDFLRRILTEEASPAIEVAQDLFTEQRGGLLTLSLLGSFWGLTRGFTAAIRALNLAYDVEEARPWLRQRLLAALLSIGSVVAAAFLLIVLVAGPVFGGARALADAVGLSGAFGEIWAVLRWPIAFCFVVLWAAAIYHFGPNRRSRLREELPGAIVTAVFGLGASAGLNIYLRLAGAANPVLGSLGGALILLIWLYLLSLSLLVGGELNAVLNEYRSR
jgi:membrane protein